MPDHAVLFSIVRVSVEHKHRYKRLKTNLIVGEVWGEATKGDDSLDLDASCEYDLLYNPYISSLFTVDSEDTSGLTGYELDSL